MTDSSEWLIYRGAGEPHDGLDRLPAPPPWRDFASRDAAGGDGSEDRRLGAYRHLAELHRPGAEELEMINAALYLRRPLLVTGSPGAGKSTLAHSVAYVEQSHRSKHVRRHDHNPHERHEHQRFLQRQFMETQHDER